MTRSLKLGSAIFGEYRVTNVDVLNYILAAEAEKKGYVPFKDEISVEDMRYYIEEAVRKDFTELEFEEYEIEEMIEDDEFMRSYATNDRVIKALCVKAEDYTKEYNV